MSNPNDQPVIPKAEPDVGPIQNEDTATAILRPKKSPNRLIVDEATADDNSVATLNPATMDTLGLFRGDTIIVRGKKRKDTVLICLSSDDIEEGKIALNKGTFNSPLAPKWKTGADYPFPFSRSKQPEGEVGRSLQRSRMPRYQVR
jgi:hypothetical protein